MTADSPLKIQPLEKYRATMTKEEVAEALGVARHIIPPLSQAGLIKPLGRPQRYCVKHYSRDVLAQQLADVNWLDKVVAAIHRHWRIKNAHKRSKQAGNGSAQPNGRPAPTSAIGQQR
jgi:hypothetical protein